MEASTDAHEGQHDYDEPIHSRITWCPDEERLINWIAKCDLERRDRNIRRMRVLVPIGIAVGIVVFIVYDRFDFLAVMFLATIASFWVSLVGESQNRSFRVIKKLIAK